MAGNGVSIGVSEHEGPAKWTIEGLCDDPKPSTNEPIMQGLGVIGREPQRDAPAEMLDRLQLKGGLFVTPQSMNEVRKQLEASGLVTRQQSPSNARILNAHLTHAGTKKWQSVDDGVRELEERLLRGLTPDEVRVLNRSLETIIRNMSPAP